MEYRTLEQDLFAVFSKRKIAVIYLKIRPVKDGLLYRIRTNTARKEFADSKYTALKKFMKKEQLVLPEVSV